VRERTDVTRVPAYFRCKAIARCSSIAVPCRRLSGTQASAANGCATRRHDHIQTPAWRSSTAPMPTQTGSSMNFNVTRPIGARRLRACSGWRAVGVGLVAAMAGVACVAPAMAAPEGVPPLVEPRGQEHHVGKVIFEELVTPDLAASKLFYAGMFGWSFQDLQSGGTRYATAWLDGRPVAGSGAEGHAGRRPPPARMADRSWPSATSMRPGRLRCAMARRCCSSHATSPIAAARRYSPTHRVLSLRFSHHRAETPPMRSPSPANGSGVRCSHAIPTRTPASTRPCSTTRSSTCPPPAAIDI
jgi:hypothetical protein